MSSEATVKCPACGKEFQLTDALAGPLLATARADYERQLKSLYEAHTKAEAEAVKAAESKAGVKAREQIANELRDAKQAASDAEVESERLQTKLIESQKAQAEALRKERAVADRERELDLTIEKQVNAALDHAKQTAYAAAYEDNKLKLLEKDTLLESMTKKIDELKQKVEQGSQQLQGEVQELDLQAKLTTAFPSDQVGEVGKGVNGADVTQMVVAPSGAQCGLILYESKRTKNWSAGWLPKLREDGRKAQADILVLVSQVMPSEVESGLGAVDRVWVVQPNLAVALAAALRATLLAVHATKQAQDGMRSKSEEVYSYVTGPQFRRRVEALVEAFTAMQDDLAKEQRAVQRLWAARSTQLERLASTTGGLFGDLQGIAGAALPEPAGLELPGGGE
jgi:hypothetical protein